MKNKLIILILFPLFCNSQDFNCSDFKTGNFIMTSEAFPNLKFKIFRDEKTQTEQIIENETLNNSFPKEMIIETIEWIDDCHYKLFFQSLGNKNDEIGNLINKNGGILTEIIPLNNRCYRYISKMNNNGKIMELIGEICKEEYN